MGFIHCARVKGGDLVIGLISRDHCLRCEGLINLTNVVDLDLQLVQAIEIRQSIAANGGHDDGIPTQKTQVVSNVACTTTEFTAHGGNQEGHIQNVNLVRQDLVLKFALKVHDGVVSNRTADQASHK